MSDHQTISFGSNYSRSMTTIANVVHHSQSLNSLSVLICKRQFQCQRQYYSHYLCLDCFQQMPQRCRRIAPRQCFSKGDTNTEWTMAGTVPFGSKKKQNNEFNQPTKYTSNDMIHFKVQQQQGKQAEAGEAWALPEKGGTTINSAIILGAIGEFLSLLF